MKAFPYIGSLIFILFVSNLQLAYSQSGNKYWVFFRDKGLSAPSGALGMNSSSYWHALENINSRALARRAKVLPENALIEFDDLPICELYINQIKNLGGTLVEQSRWLNAASFYLSSEQITAAGFLTFVKEIKPVRTIAYVALTEPRKLSAQKKFPALCRQI